MRIVVIANGSALATNLSLFRPEWDVELVADGVAVSGDAMDGLVISADAFGPVERILALRTAATHPVVFIGDAATAVDDVPAVVSLLLAPFELRDLVALLVPDEGQGEEGDGEVVTVPSSRWRSRSAPRDGAAIEGAGAHVAPSGRVPFLQAPEPVPQLPMSVARFSERVGEALLSVDRVRGLVTEAPSLADRDAIGAAILAEVEAVAEAEAEVVVVLARSDDRLGVMASHGLTPHEEASSVALDHPFLRALGDRVEPAYFERRGDAEALVAGLPGARTAFVTVAPIRRGGAIIGLIAVGSAATIPGLTRQLERIVLETEPVLALSLSLAALAAAVVEAG